MTWPERPWWLGLRLDLAFGADVRDDPPTWPWVDVSSDVPAQELALIRGRSDESAQPQPSSVSMELDNGSGAYTPDNPMSPYYGQLVTGVPARLWLQVGGPHLLIPDSDHARARVASSAALDVTEDLDVRVEMALDRVPAQWGASPPPGFTPYRDAEQEIIARYNTTGVPGQRMWRLMLTSWGHPTVMWSTDGDDFTSLTADEAVPYIGGQRFALRATLDVDNGDAAHVATFYVADSIAGPWRQLGQAATAAGTTSINQIGDASLELGNINTVVFPPGAGRYYAAELRDGIDGPLLASPDFTAQEPGATEFTDEEGNLWQVQFGAEITDWVRHMVGTVDEWAPNWPYGDLSTASYPGESRTSIAISGILRRLGQGAPTLQSTLRRRIPGGGGDPALVPLAYWPMEEGRDASRAYSPLDGVEPLQAYGLQWASDDTLAGSDALPTLGQAADIYGPVPAAAQGGWTVDMTYRLDELPATEQTMLRAYLTGGTAAFVQARASTAGIRIEAWNGEGARIAHFLFSDPAALAAFTGWNRLQLFSATVGSDTYIHAYWRDVITGVRWYARTVYTGTPGAVSGVRGAWGGDFTGMAIGHIGVWDVGGTTDGTLNSQPGITYFDDADDGYESEYALERMRRLASEEALPLTVLGTPSRSARMGPQRIATALELIQECADADGGILSEGREVSGLQYRPRYLLYNQQPMLILDGQRNEITTPLSPVLDDQRLRNEVTAQRTGGSAAQARDTASIARSGLYDESVTVNVAADEQLPNLAAWRLHLGTWPGMRYPSVSADLAVAPQTIPGWLTVTSGSRLQVTGLPPQHPADTVDLMVQGTTETITPTSWTVQATCTPAGPWTVGQVAPDDPEVAGPDAPLRADTDGSVLAAAAGEADTALSVTVTDGPRWTTDPAEFPFDVRVGGEVVRVTAISGTTSPQTFTVTRSVTGITKAHSAGTDVRLAHPAITAL